MTSAAMWGGIVAVVLTSTAGDVLQSSAMKQVGDVGLIRQSCGLEEVLRRVLTNRRFLLAVFFMALGFFSLIITLSWGDVSVVGPAAASLAFIVDAAAAKLFLNEHVDRRRWLAALFVAGGVALLTR
jgi:drug/metabolite transporter (DMT)-like permease